MSHAKGASLTRLCYLHGRITIVLGSQTEGFKAKSYQSSFQRDHSKEIEMCIGMFKDQAEVVVAQEEVQEKIDLVENEEELIEEEEQ
ncbi:hypothetical protein Tco_0982199 [Tanacetum coccineum]